MSPKAEVWQGTLALMVLKTLETMGPLHGYGLARRIDWGVSDNHRKAKFYGLTPAGRKRTVHEIRDWHDATSIIDRFLWPEETS